MNQYYKESKICIGCHLKGMVCVDINTFYFFSLSDEDRDNADSLIIKPPQAVVRPSHREKRGHKRSIKDRYKEPSRKEKKHLFRYVK